MTNIARTYPNTVKWLKAARAAAIKTANAPLTTPVFRIGAGADCTYITDGYFALRIPQAEVPAWASAVNLAPLPDAPEFPDGLRSGLDNMFTTTSFDEAMLDTGMLTHALLGGSKKEVLCRVFSLGKEPYILQESFVEALREIGPPPVVELSLSGGPSLCEMPEDWEGDDD